ncbi:MAG TPA: aminotransferase class I/II-fold pyridoxal phosphate-dependent enzyme, partial [Acidimicrobiales bacterium]|nr:aminotransferase class I/II-fold pyridoxal phosphate-dependent enzyme [Acidimicrobiales bacterium]
GRDVVSLCAGEPSGGAPTDVRERAAELHSRSRSRSRRRSLHSQELDLGYTPALGLHDLRVAIAGHYRRWYGVEVDPATVAITTGASGAFVLLFLAAFDAGDRVAVARPGYPAYRNLLHTLGIDVVEVPVGPDTGFQPTVAALDELEAAAAAAGRGPLDGLVLASPANPTGSMVDRAELTALAEWCAAHDVRLISDEIYHGITYPPDASGADGGVDAPDARGCSAASLDLPASAADAGPVVVSSFSKYWGMTGWRLGWSLVPGDLRDAVDALAGNVALCPPTPAQLAALRAFSDRSYAEADARVAELARTRALLLGSLDRLGWGPIAPAAGAFYLWAGIAEQLGPHRDSVAWCRALLDEAGVAVVPGTDMDAVDGGTFIRVSFAAGTAAVAEAVERIVAFQA